jgi:general stress protein YciG
MGEQDKLKWMETMIKKFGSEEAVKQEMRRRQEASRKTYKGTGGFASLTKEERQEISKKGNATRWKSSN